MARTDEFRNRASACEAADDVTRSPEEAEMIGDVILKRYSRREMMGGTLGVVAVASLFGPSLLASGKAAAEESYDRFAFQELEAGIDIDHHVAPGYRARPLLRWGDRLFPDFAVVRSAKADRGSQLRQFGYNNDYIAYFPIDAPPRASGRPRCWRWPTRSSRTATAVAVEAENTGKPTALTSSEEIGPMVDQIRFFAGAARVLGGPSEGEYMRGHTSSIRREPVGVVGQWRRGTTR